MDNKKDNEEKVKFLYNNLEESDNELISQQAFSKSCPQLNVSIFIAN